MDETKELAEECYDLISRFFNKDEKKVDMWFRTRNPLLGNTKPLTMLYRGRGKKLLQFIKACLDGNLP